MKKAKTTIPVNHALLNVISPIGLLFNKTNLMIGENVGKVYGVIKYPPSPDFGWLSRITNLHSSIVSISFNPIDPGSFIEVLSNNIRRQTEIAETEKEPLLISRAKKAAEDSEKTMVNIDIRGEQVGKVGITILPLSRELDLFEKITQRVVTTCSISKCKTRVLSLLQEQGFKHISPFYGLDPDVNMIIEKPAPLSTIIGGFPFSTSGYNDGNGYYFAKDSSGGLIILDLWKRMGDRTNSNMFISGLPGVGKSTVVKSIMLSEYMMGTTIIVLDPEREYKEICESVNGDWINCGGGAGGIINPMQVKPVPMDDEDDEVKLYCDRGEGIGALALHIQSLEVLFTLYKTSITDAQMSLLKRFLRLTYEQFNITWTTDVTKLRNDQFPTFVDLYMTSKEQRQLYRTEGNNYEADLADSLTLLLEDLAVGSDSFLWSRHSTLSTKTRFICMDTKDLQNAGDNIKRAQYYNLMTYGWDIMSRDRTERVLFFADEYYLVVDPKNPQPLIYTRNMLKRSRKYEAGVGIITHDVNDILHEDIKMYGQSVISTPCIKVLMGTDGQNLKETANLFNLSVAEKELLEAKKRKQALLFIGSKRLSATFELPEYKLEMMGTAGGR